MYSDERTVLMPILARGGHSHPRYGACLTEVAAVLTTHRWTDHPGCVPRLLGRVARRVNDLTSPGARTGLAPLIPWTVCDSTAVSGLTRDAAVTSALASRALSRHPGDHTVAELCSRLARVSRPRHPLEQVGWLRVARELVRLHVRDAMGSASTAESDDELRNVLLVVINAQRSSERRPPITDPCHDGQRIRDCFLPVTTHLVRPDGIFELEVIPQLDAWPEWLGIPWRQRQDELTTDPVTVPG